MSLFKHLSLMIMVGLLLAACTTLEVGVERTPVHTSAATEAASAPVRLASSPTVPPTQIATLVLADTPTSTFEPKHETTEIPLPSSTLTPLPPYLAPTPIPAGQMRGEWDLITSADGLCTDTPLFIGSDFIGIGTTKMCYFTDQWVTVEVPQGSRVTAANRFPPGGGWGVATDVGICHFPFGEWKCQTTAEGFPYAEIKSLIPLESEAAYMLTDTVAFRSVLYRIPDIVGDVSARPTWINVSGEFFGEGFLTPEIWIGTNGYGVVVVQPATGNNVRYITADGLPSNTVRDVETEMCPKFCGFRDIWVATDGGVGHWDGTQWIAYTTADGLPSNDVRGVAPVQRNVVWAATAKGAAYFDGQAWRAFTLADGLPVEDLQGVIWRRYSVWFNTLGQGLVTFSQQQPQSQLPAAIAARSSLPSPLPTPMLTPAPTITPVPFASVKVAEVIEAPDTNEAHNVERISHVKTVGAAFDVIVVDDFAYVTDSEVGLQVVDIAAINNLMEHTAKTSKSLAVKPPGLAMASRVALVDNTQSQPYLGRGPQAYRLVVSGKLVYLVGQRTWQIVDISNPRAPNEISLQYVRDIFDIAIEGDHAYFANGIYGMDVADVSNPSTPVEVGAYSPSNEYVQGLTTAGDYVYVAGSKGLTVLDGAEPTHPIEVSTYKTPFSSWDVEVRGKYAFVAWNLRGAVGGPVRHCNSGVVIVDVSEPTTPVEVGQYCDPGREVADVAVAQNYMYVAAGSRGLRVLEISNPASPTEVGFYDTPSDAQRVTTAGPYIFVADSSGGLFILRSTLN